MLKPKVIAVSSMKTDCGDGLLDCERGGCEICRE